MEDLKKKVRDYLASKESRETLKRFLAESDARKKKLATIRTQAVADRGGRIGS